MRADRTSKPASPKQLEANRLNAKRSTGPRTAAGRARSRMNALRHGLCARVVLLPGEDRSAYGIFAKRIVDELRPKGLVQQMLAGRVAALFWALSRLPRAVKHLVDRGEDQRWHHWFNTRGLNELAWARATYDPANDKEPWADHPDVHARAGFNENDDQFIDRELAKAYADGNPPPDPHKAPGVIADAIAGQHGFEAVLKLDEHERRLWAALQSALRSLERRQKIDGCADEDEEPREDEQKDDAKDQSWETSPPEVPACCDTGFQPVPEPASAQAAPASETAGPEHGLQTRVTESAPDTPRPPCEPPARNEPNSQGDAVAHCESEIAPVANDALAQASAGGIPDAQTAGAERTHLASDDNPASARFDAAPPPDRGHAAQRGDPLIRRIDQRLALEAGDAASGGENGEKMPPRPAN